jgi:hypothetical protein
MIRLWRWLFPPLPGLAAKWPDAQDPAFVEELHRLRREREIATLREIRLRGLAEDRAWSQRMERAAKAQREAALAGPARQKRRGIGWVRGWMR